MTEGLSPPQKSRVIFNDSDVPLTTDELMHLFVSRPC